MTNRYDDLTYDQLLNLVEPSELRHALDEWVDTRLYDYGIDQHARGRESGIYEGTHRGDTP